MAKSQTKPITGTGILRRHHERKKIGKAFQICCQKCHKTEAKSHLKARKLSSGVSTYHVLFLTFQILDSTVSRCNYHDPSPFVYPGLQQDTGQPRTTRPHLHQNRCKNLKCKRASEAFNDVLKRNGNNNLIAWCFMLDIQYTNHLTMNDSKTKDQLWQRLRMTLVKCE